MNEEYKNKISELLASAARSKTPELSYELYCEDMKSKGKEPDKKLWFFSDLQAGETSRYWKYYEKASRIEKLERICKND